MKELSREYLEGEQKAIVEKNEQLVELLNKINSVLRA
jgi:hypothetical protein